MRFCVHRVWNIDDISHWRTISSIYLCNHIDGMKWRKERIKSFRALHFYFSRLVHLRETNFPSNSRKNTSKDMAIAQSSLITFVCIEHVLLALFENTIQQKSFYLVVVCMSAWNIWNCDTRNAHSRFHIIHYSILLCCTNTHTDMPKTQHSLWYRNINAESLMKQCESYRNCRTAHTYIT